MEILKFNFLIYISKNPLNNLVIFEMNKDRLLVLFWVRRAGSERENALTSGCTTPYISPFYTRAHTHTHVRTRELMSLKVSSSASFGAVSTFHQWFTLLTFPPLVWSKNKSWPQTSFSLLLLCLESAESSTPSSCSSPHRWANWHPA